LLHFVPETTHPGAAIARYLGTIAPGSYFVLSHGTNDGLDEEPVEAHNSYQRTTTPGIGRSRTEILELMTGTELVEPGIVWTPQWRPDSPEDVDEQPERSLVYAAVARKP